MHYELNLGEYRGPLEKLLELVEKKKMEITKISLAAVTADFLDYLRKIEEAHVHHFLVGDFLVIASRLVLIKSKVLLPSLELESEEENEIKNLELRLKIYAEFKEAQKIVKDQWHDKPQMAAREFLAAAGPIFYPPLKVTKEKIQASLQRVLTELQEILKPVGKIKNEVINLKKKIEEILGKITKSPKNFNELKNNESRGEIVVIFLAILHLIKYELVQVEQLHHFGEMKIVKKDEAKN